MQPLLAYVRPKSANVLDVRSSRPGRLAVRVEAIHGWAARLLARSERLVALVDGTNAPGTVLHGLSLRTNVQLSNFSIINSGSADLRAIVASKSTVANRATRALSPHALETIQTSERNLGIATVAQSEEHAACTRVVAGSMPAGGSHALQTRAGRVRDAGVSIPVAALYVDGMGVYPKLGVDCWDAERDARTYAGPWPVVAHPPCGPWGRLRHLYRGDEHELAPLAVEQVRRWGGVLEHPAGSRLWKHCRLPAPGELPDEHGGRTIEVCQCDWGHVARKKTWLYLVRVPSSALQWPPHREPTHWISGGRTLSRKGGRAGGGIVPPGIKVCSEQQRRRTPVDFARYLISLALASAPKSSTHSRGASLPDGGEPVSRADERGGATGDERGRVLT